MPLGLSYICCITANTLVLVDDRRSKISRNSVFIFKKITDSATRFKNNSHVNLGIKFTNKGCQFLPQCKTLVTTKDNRKINYVFRNCSKGGSILAHDPVQRLSYVRVGKFIGKAITVKQFTEIFQFFMENKYDMLRVRELI